MSEAEAKEARRRRLGAAGLSLVAPGVGQIRLGHIPRGLAWMTLATIAPFVPALVWGELGTGALAAMHVAALVVVLGSAIDALFFCPERGPVPGATLLGIVIGFFVVAPIVVAVELRAFVLEAFKIPSGGMMPTLLVGDHLFVDKMVYRRREPRRGEPMVFAFPEHPEQDFVKRVIGVGGDRIVVRDGRPIVNGWEVPRCAAGRWRYKEADDGAGHEGALYVEFLGDASYLVFLDATAPGEASFEGPFTVASGQFFVMGDNRNNSHDSRKWFAGEGGTVPLANVRGRPRLIWLSQPTPGRFGIDVGGATPSPAPNTDAAAIAACLRARPTTTAPPPPQ